MNKFGNRMGVTLIVATSTLLALPALAQFAKPEDAIGYRQSVMTVMSAHFGRIGAVVKGVRPFEAADVQANAAIVETMSKLAFDGFGPGTDKGETKAKPEIWANSDKFKSAAEQMQKAVLALSSAAKAGNPDQVKAAFGDVGKTCKACHDDFRKK
jgi:cytochrome c556